MSMDASDPHIAEVGHEWPQHTNLLPTIRKGNTA